MIRHEDYCTLLRNPEDQDILTRRLFNINERLYHTSEQYRNIIKSIADYIWWCYKTEKTGYTKPMGYSGANAGIPFNIIAANDKIMLNPCITKRSKETRIVKSNCGSLQLSAPIDVRRYTNIVCRYIDLVEKEHVVDGFFPTVQHEIDHNNGVLITDLNLG